MKLWMRSLTVGIFAIAVAGAFSGAHACWTDQPLGKADYAAADIVFEGIPVAVHPTFKPLNPQLLKAINQRSKHKRPHNDQVTEFDISFEVSRVLRGELTDKVIRVGWIHGTFGYPRSHDEFVQRYGDELRVGLTTYNLYQQMCPVKPTWNTRGGEAPKKEMRRSCDVMYTGFFQYEGQDETKPFILNAPCSGPYMLPLDSDEDGMATL